VFYFGLGLWVWGVCFRSVECVSFGLYVSDDVLVDV